MPSYLVVLNLLGDFGLLVQLLCDLHSQLMKSVFGYLVRLNHLLSVNPAVIAIEVRFKLSSLVNARVRVVR